MPEIIADASVLITLDNINRLQILNDLYKTIIITPEVEAEFGVALPDWIQIRPVQDQNYLHILTTVVDLGEASSIALALEIPNSLLILDDLKARKLAAELHLSYTGLLGVILKAKELLVIPSVTVILNELKSVNFRFSSSIERKVLQIAQE